jgi:hypothetical protein
MFKRYYILKNPYLGYVGSECEPLVTMKKARRFNQLDKAKSMKGKLLEDTGRKFQILKVTVEPIN